MSERKPVREQFRTLDEPDPPPVPDDMIGSGAEPDPIRSVPPVPRAGRWWLPHRPSMWARFWAWFLFGAEWRRNGH